MSGRGPTRVIVVGGGLAGLTAALACADAGADVTVFEARPRLGGATFSFRREGLRVDNGQHVFLRCCTAYRSFLNRVGAEGLVTLQPRLRIPLVSPGGRMATLGRSPLPAPLHLAGSLARYPFLSVGERIRLVRAAAAMMRLDPVRDRASLDRLTFGAWLERHGQSPNAVDALWDLIALPTLNLHARDASLALAAKVFRTGLLDSASAGDVGYATAPLSEVHAEPAERALRAVGGRVVARAAVRTVEPATGSNGDRARPAVRVDGERVEADAVVVAVPHQDAAGMLPAGPEVARWATLGSSPIVNLHVVYDRPVLGVPFAAGVGTPVQWVFDRTRQSGLGGGAGRYVAVSLSGAEEEIDEPTATLKARFLPALVDVLPAARMAQVRSFFVTRERAATFRQAPGTAASRPGPRSPCAGVFMAGAWTDTGWPATMEGAVRSGLAAAREALGAAGSAVGSPARTAVAFEPDAPVEEVPA